MARRHLSPTPSPTAPSPTTVPVEKGEHSPLMAATRATPVSQLSPSQDLAQTLGGLSQGCSPVKGEMTERSALPRGAADISLCQTHTRLSKSLPSRQGL